MSDRPIIWCLVARPLPGGEFTRTARVPLGAVPTYLKAGFVAVGPDPADMEALAQYERETWHLNRPRWHQQ
jgi:hypothetical protein